VRNRGRKPEWEGVSELRVVVKKAGTHKPPAWIFRKKGLLPRGAPKPLLGVLWVPRLRAGNREIVLFRKTTCECVPTIRHSALAPPASIPEIAQKFRSLSEGVDAGQAKRRRQGVAVVRPDFTRPPGHPAPGALRQACSRPPPTKIGRAWGRAMEQPRDPCPWRFSADVGFAGGEFLSRPAGLVPSCGRGKIFTQTAGRRRSTVTTSG